MSNEIKQNYQETLNLPKTDFSMRAGLAKKEPEYLKKWEEMGLYAAMRQKAEGKKSFVLHDGPPYANGNIHIGHALNKLLKDFIIKFKTMDGFDALYVPGWDCHGLPIEHQLLKELKKKKADVDCVEFRKSAHDYAMKYVGIQREQFERLGIFGQWDDPYLTLDTEYEYWILKSLSELNKKGYVYRGLKPVNWCFNCETALAEAEVEHADHSSPTVFVKFETENAQVLGSECEDKNCSLLIWTTTPWTLLANVAVSINQSFTYGLFDVGGEIIIVEKSLAPAIFEKSGVNNANLIKEVLGEELTQLTYKHPFGVKEHCRVVCADYVTKEDGTGLVHTAPGHGQDDFDTGKKNDLDIVMPVNDRGVYTHEAGSYEGQHVFKANPLIIEDLKNKGALFFTESIAHSYPHCWRCKKPIIFRATQQWFLKIDHENLRGKLKEAIQSEVQWIPETGKDRIMSMVTGRPDWCLSRQRYWGVPIPAIECHGCNGDHYLETDVIDHFCDIVKHEGTNAWFERDIKDLLPQGFQCSQCGGSEFKKTHDILDVWFDSGVSHQSVVKAKMGKSLPVDLYLEGSDQHRGWFQSSLIPAVAMEGHPPFKAVLTHGFVVDKDGRKMSKSLGNVISPLDIMKNSGADILRLWVAFSSYNEDIRISKESLDRIVDSYRKIRNTLRYLLGNLNGFDPQMNMLSYDDLLDIDKWALHSLSKMMNNVHEDFQEYDFAKAIKSAYKFCNEDLSSFYLDILKDRLYTSATNSSLHNSAQTVLYHITNCLVRSLAPVLSFTAEEVFWAMPKNQELNQVSSVHLLEWPQLPNEWTNTVIEKKFDFLVRLRPFVLKLLEDKRRGGEIGSSLQAKIIFKTNSQRDLEALVRDQEFLSDYFIVSSVEILKEENVSQAVGDEFPKMEIIIEKAPGEKCERCWNFKEDIGKQSAHPTLCGRCTKIVINN